MASRIGRPPIPVNKRRVSQSITLDPPTWKQVEKMAVLHGVSRSQVFDDALKSYVGELEDLLRHLREELSSQEANVKTLQLLTKQQEEELGRLKASQTMVSNILNPYAPGNDKGSKELKEKSRCLRAILNNQNLETQLFLLAEGKLDKPTLPILIDAKVAFGSWESVKFALDAARGVSK